MPHKILVIHLAGIGDLLMGLPALQALRTRFPESRVILLTWRKADDVARLIPVVDEHDWLDERRAWSAVRHNCQVMMRLRRMRVDLAVNLYQVYRWIGAMKLGCVFHVIGPRQTAGRDTDGKGVVFDHKVDERSSDSRHEVDRQLALVQRLGGLRPEPVAALSLDPHDHQTVERWLAEAGVRPDERLIGIHPGGARASHRWPWCSFAAVARVLEARDMTRIVLTGSGEERRLTEQIAGELRRPLVTAGELSLGQLAWLFRRCQVVIANDSGPMHLAATLRVPLVAILGPTDPQRYGPYPLSRPDQLILHPAGCVPCYRNHCGGHAAFEQLSTGTVLEAAESILKGQHPPGTIEVPPRLRVLHVHTLPVISGSGINTLLSMCGQREAGFDVELACAPGGPLLELVEQHGMRARPLRHLVWPIHPFHDPLVVWELVRLMRRQRYTIVHTHNSKAGFVGRLAAKLAGVPIIVHTVHGFAFHEHEPWWRRQLYRGLEQLAAHWCDRLIMISQPLVEWALRAHIAPRAQMVKIYSGIDLKAFRQPIDRARLRAALGFQDHEFVVGEVAKLWRGKGHEVLFRAAANLTDRLPSLRLLIVGEGGLRPFLTRLSEDLGIRERVVFTGFRQDIPALTQVVDVAVLPTQFEGMGRAVLEAQAAGKPVIASRVGGVPDLIVDGQTGLLVDPGNVDQLADAIWQLSQHPEQRRQLGEAAQRAVDERFDAATMARQIVQVYKEVLAQKGHPNP